MTTTLNEIDWEQVQSIIDSMRNISDEIDPQQLLQNKLHYHSAKISRWIDQGWPFQEVAFTIDDEPMGIPIDLASLILGIFDFCAYANIDLGSAIKMAQDV